MESFSNPGQIDLIAQRPWHYSRVPMRRRTPHLARPASPQAVKKTASRKIANLGSKGKHRKNPTSGVGERPPLRLVGFVPVPFLGTYAVKSVNPRNLPKEAHSHVCTPQRLVVAFECTRV